MRWQKTVSIGDKEKGRNNMASPSPVTDGKSVYVMFGTGDLASYDFAGNLLWERHLGVEYGRIANMWIYGSSPLLFQGKLYIQVLQRNPPPPDYPSVDDKPTRESYLLCLDPKTGKNIWRHVRETDAGECQDIRQEKDIFSSAQRLSPTQTLYQIGCWRAAYQSGAMLYLGAPTVPAAARRLVFETLDEATGKIVANLASLTDPSEVDEAGAMASFNKGRGVGDCGTSWSWAWTGQGFRLTSYVSMPECRGIAAEDWITLWQARTK